MQVNILNGGDGEVCWNADAIANYVATVNSQEARLADNPDVAITSGKIACQGCVVNQWGNGTMCTAQLTETVLVMKGKRAPVEGSASGSTRDIHGFNFVKPGSKQTQS